VRLRRKAAQGRPAYVFFSWDTDSGRLGGPRVTGPPESHDPPKSRVSNPRPQVGAHGKRRLTYAPSNHGGETMLSLSRITSGSQPTLPFGLDRKVSERGFHPIPPVGAALLWAGETPGEGPAAPSEDAATRPPAQGEGRRILVASFENHSRSRT